MKPEWEDRLKHWLNTLKKEFYQPMGDIVLEGFNTYDLLSPEEAEQGTFTPMPEGTVWGCTWAYAWFRGDIAPGAALQGKRLVMNLNAGGEATLFVNGEAFGTRRAEWVKEPHHYICDQVLTDSFQPGQTFHLLMEAYAGHDYPKSETGLSCSTGPIRPDEGDYAPRDEQELRQKVGHSTWGIWHEEAYQLWMDVMTLNLARSAVDPSSLRLCRLEEALETFMLETDFEQPRQQRLENYARVRELLKPALSAHNGSTMPRFTAIGNAHLDVCWLWPYRETERKVARTFAQQLRLMDMYPEYKFLQSTPETYQICKTLYPKLYEKVKEKIRDGQWIADGSMWVEPDTNMTSGESLIRQLIHGKRFYREEFGIDCQTLWLPDTFGYSAVLPQLLKGCGVRYLTTQKIFWTYNGSDRFPYHYFTWQGMDGSEVTSFLHMDYTSRTDPATLSDRWKNRVQQRDLDRFLLPFGYGDGGGGPTRDDIEYLRREEDLEGVPKTTMEAPEKFFNDYLAEEGAPKHRYVGELYFQCHRGTYTGQAAIKRGNRKSEIMLREAEMWAVAAMDKRPYPMATLDGCWKHVLLNQFHDILPGSSIARVYDEARTLYVEILANGRNVVNASCAALTQGEEGTTYFNSLSWDRNALVKTDKGYGVAHIPACGWTSEVDEDLPAFPVTVQQDEDTVTLDNGVLCVKLNHLGEIIDCRDQAGHQRIGGKGNVLKMYKDVPRLFDAWDIDSMYDRQGVPIPEEAALRILEDTPWKAVVEVTRILDHSLLVQQISLEAGSTRVDFDTKVDWQECHRLLKVGFATGICTEEGINEIQFGYVKRPTHRSRPYDADRFEVCNHRYTALCDENRGAAVLNDCKYGVSMLGDEIALTLLRASTCPDLTADRGEHHFTYSYYVWDGPFGESDVVRQGYELNVPVTKARGTRKTGSMMHLEGSSSVIIETVKAAEDGSGDVIVRLYESKHASCDAVLALNLPAERITLCNMLEEPVEELPDVNGRVALTFRPFEIKTVRLSAHEGE